MPAQLHQRLKDSRPMPRVFLWTLLGIFNVLLWLLLLAFQWQISMRLRENIYFGTRLFPLNAQVVPLPVIFSICGLLTLVSAAAILRDRSNLVARERNRILLLQILDSLSIGVVVLDNKDLLTMANDSARRLLPEIPPDYASPDILNVLEKRPELRDIVKAATRQGAYVQDIEHDLGDPPDPWPVRVTTLPLKDPHKRTTGTLLLVHDIRDIVRMERQMQTAERLSALGTLAAAMAHEIRNPLEALDLNLALLERSVAATNPEASDGSKTGKYVKVLESEISRLASIVENFLSFARPSASSSSEVRLDDILRQIVDLLYNQASSRKVKLELSTKGDPVVLGSEDQLKQAVLNLSINSLEAMPSGGMLRIFAGIARHQGTGGTQNLAVVRIQDTGVGIPQEQIARLFDPFFTTRPRGTGLGLTIVHRIIHQHKGTIRVASLPGEGTTFTLEFPLHVPSGIRKATSHV